MAIAAQLLKAADQEWQRWGFSKAPLLEAKVIGGIESKQPFAEFVREYWTAVEHPELNGLSASPWSAAFVSFCFAAAGAQKGFPYHIGHWGYCARIVNSPAKFAGLSFEDPAKTVLAPGDIIVAARKGTPLPPTSFADALQRLRSTKKNFPSHGDIVVEVRPGEVDVIGGNVANSVTKSTYLTVQGRIADQRHVWIGVVKNRL